MTSAADELIALMASYEAKMKNITDDEFRALLERNGYQLVRKLEDGTWIGLTPLLFTVGLCIGLGPIGWERRYCYDDVFLAMEEMGKLEHGAQVPNGWIAKRPQ